MHNKKRYNTLNQFLRNKFGEKVFKICIDGGFTCPNRDGAYGIGGCIFCGERGAGEHITNNITIKQQVKNYLVSKPQKGKYIAYFQNFTNTYAPLETLKIRYDAALCDSRIVALAVGTRPDCIDEDVAKLLSLYSKKYYVWVELGLQTANDKTSDIINRGYHKETFIRIVQLLNNYGIDIVVHLILGLPSESENEVNETIALINASNVQGIKIHSLYIMKGTVLAEMYKNGKFAPISAKEYIRLASLVISKINPEIIIHRVTGDCPKDLLVAPDWNMDKNSLINGIDDYLQKNEIYQGSLYNNDSRI